MADDEEWVGYAPLDKPPLACSFCGSSEATTSLVANRTGAASICLDCARAIVRQLGEPPASVSHHRP